MSTESSVTLEELYDYLQQFSLSDSLFVIGSINAAVKYGHRIPNTEDIPQAVINYIALNCKTHIERMTLSMHLTRLARFLLLSQSNDSNDKIPDLNTPELAQCLSLISRFFDKKIEGPINTADDLSYVFGRMGQWQFFLQTPPQVLIGRGNLLFLELPKEIGIPYDTDAKMKEYFDIGVFEFVASGICLWVKSSAVLKHQMTISIKGLKNIVDTASIQKFTELSSGTKDDYKEKVRSGSTSDETAFLDSYGLEPFLFMPAIQVQQSQITESGNYIVPQPLYLLHRSSLGIFYLLANKEQEIGTLKGSKKYNPFRENFGSIYREYVKRNLNQVPSSSVFIDLDEDFEQASHNDELPDFAIVEGDICTLFEVKTTPFSVKTRTALDAESARKDAKKEGPFKKSVSQLNTFEEAILGGKVADPRLQSIKKVAKVLISFEDLFLANALFLPLTREIYGEIAALNFQILGITDLEILGGVIANGESIGKHLIDKESSGNAHDSTGQYFSNLDTEKENPILENAYERFWDRLFRKPN